MPKKEEHSNLNHLPHYLIDSFNRHLTYLRISVTDKCNFRCNYCMSCNNIKKLTNKEILTFEEITRIAKIFVNLGINKIRITGGEPFLRNNLATLLMNLNRLRPKPDLRITTNGLFLKENLKNLIKYEVNTINISFDTLNPKIFGEITGLSSEARTPIYKTIWENIKTTLAINTIKTKLNVVVLAGINENQITKFAKLTKNKNIAVRFIEYMPVGEITSYNNKRFVSSNKILKYIKKVGEIIPLHHKTNDGPAQRFRLIGSKGELGIISAVSNHFCNTCNRLRLSAEGLLVPCLLSKSSLNIRKLLRDGIKDKELIKIILKTIKNKPRGHNQRLNNLYSTEHLMNRLGG